MTKDVIRRQKAYLSLLPHSLLSQTILLSILLDLVGSLINGNLDQNSIFQTLRAVSEEVPHLFYHVHLLLGDCLHAPRGLLHVQLGQEGVAGLHAEVGETVL